MISVSFINFKNSAALIRAFLSNQFYPHKKVSRRCRIKKSVPKGIDIIAKAVLFV